MSINALDLFGWPRGNLLIDSRLPGSCIGKNVTDECGACIW
jgi:hypothetical protein